MIDGIKLIFSNREIASALWLLVLVVPFVIAKKKVRQSLKTFLKAFFDFKIIKIILCSLCYVVLIIVLLYLLKFWEYSMTKASIYWFIFTALGILYNYINKKEGENYFKTLLIHNFKLTLLLEFIINIHQFNLFVEFIFIGLVGLFSVIIAISETEPKLNKLSNFISFLLSTVGLILVALSIRDIYKSFSDYASIEELKDFLLPIILSICFIPYAFLFALFVEYESLFTNYKIYIDNKKLRRYARIRTLVRYRFQLSKIRNLRPITAREFYYGINKNEIKKVLNKPYC